MEALLVVVFGTPQLPNHGSGPRLLLTVLAIVFGAVALVTLGLAALPRLGDRPEGILEVLLLALLIAPLLWWTVVRPLRRSAQEAIRSSQGLYRALFEQSPDAVLLLDAETGRTIEANPAASKQLGYAPEEFVGLRISDYEAVETPEETRRHIQELLAAGSGDFETQHRTKGGEIRDVHVWARPLQLDDRNAFHCIFEDITDRKRAEKVLRGSLREKDALLKEVHHRVKNNLQVITSLLRLEASRIDHATTKAVLKDVQNRILSMALLHETLYRSGNFSQVDLAVYLRVLTGQLARSLGPTPGSLDLRLDLTSVRLSLEQAVPCGLIVNELVSNAFKHAFPAGRSGTIWVELHQIREEAVRLRVRDDGVGVPSDFEDKRARALGLQLVGDLARQLHGSLQTASGPGTSFEVTFILEDSESVAP